MHAGDNSKTSLMKRKFTWLSRGLMLLYAMTVCLLCFTHFDGSINMNEEWFGIGKDKIAHFLMFLPFPILMYMAFHTHHGNPWRLIIFMTVTILIGAAAGAGIELLQMTTKYRSCDILDFRADCIGLLAGSFLVMIYAAVSRKW